MAKAKEMPYGEKYAIVLDYMKLLDRFVLPLVKENLGEQGVVELQGIWQKGLNPIPDDATYEEKYELAFGNWIQKWGSAFTFIRDQLGKKGVQKFERADVEALKRKSSGLALILLKVMRALSPKFAFQTFAKQMAYQMQVFSSYSVSELTGRRLVLTLPHCKILDFTGGEDACLVGCQTVYPMWLSEQSKVNMKTERQGKSCTVTLTPM